MTWALTKKFEEVFLTENIEKLNIIKAIWKVSNMSTN